MGGKAGWMGGQSARVVGAEVWEAAGTATYVWPGECMASQLRFCSIMHGVKNEKSPRNEFVR